ncbi:tetratricopeptide repeat protein [Streptomyces sp. HUCO-GS316]|uniref:ATP-binding protein n=1 Tax=Streptomyces sp. HUCO-GS316 TaxID=2692198 RepID=UPI0013700BF3|nr:tetratricopeptide repeat protein [Streptomyces sp. HUCO-GS316]MXM65883.1 tetratricopeptide repeat protein [Streptomyces sp. HUCO-GS316]
MPRSYEDYELFVDCFVRACLAHTQLPAETLQTEVDRWCSAWRALANAPSSDVGTEHSPPRLLPPSTTSHLAGRRSHVEELDRLLAGSSAKEEVPLVSITGPPGVGKTALAIHWAHRAAERFPDGQLYVDLRGWDGDHEVLAPETVLSRFLRDLRVPDAELPSTLDELEARFRSETADRRMLLVLDNAAGPEQIRPLLPGSRHCRTVVTSRAPLTGIGARAMPLDVLSETESFELIASLIGVVRAQDEPDAVSLVARLCARLPLALRIVGEGIAVRPAISVAEAAEEIADESTRLDTLGVGTDEAHDIRSVFSWSLRYLSPPAARLFRLLGLHEGPDLPLPVVAALADMPPAAARHLVHMLVRVNLIEQRPGGRYRFHDLLRLYARERAMDLPQEQRIQAVERLSAWYLKAGDASDRVFAPSRRRVPIHDRDLPHVPAAPPMADHRAAFAWGDTERENVLSVVRQCAREELHEVAWQLPAVMGEYFYLRKMWADLYATHKDALPSAQRTSLVAEAWIRSNLGFAGSHIGMYREAEEHCRRAVEATTSIGDPMSTGIAWNNLGIALGGLREWDEALAAFQRALELHRSQGNQWGEAHALMNMARAHAGRGEWDAAVELYVRAGELHGAIGNRVVEGTVLHELGLAHAAQARWEQATDCYQRALAIHNEVDNRIGAGITLDDLAAALLARGHRDEALDRWRQALIVLEELAHPRAELVRSHLESAQR